MDGELHTGAKPSSGPVSSTSHDEICAFCQSSGDSEAVGPLLHYLEGKAVTILQAGQTGIIHVHQKCLEWAPNVYYLDECVRNLEVEIGRSSKINCYECGQKGAALGCYAKNCHQSFHVRCALDNPGFQCDGELYIVLCPLHSSSQLLVEKFHSKKEKRVLLKPSRFLKANQQKMNG